MLKTRIVLVDDHRVLLDALRFMIEPEFEVVGLFEDSRSVLEQVGGLQPEVIVLDIGMPLMNGLSVAEHIKKVLPKARLLFLSASEDLETVAEAFKIGAAGYVLKAAAGRELMVALREVARGGYYASPALTHDVIGSFVKAFKQMKISHRLTSRQREVLKLLAEGFSMKEVGLILGITPRTVAFHKYTMMEQFHIRSTAELMKFAASHLK